MIGVRITKAAYHSRSFEMGSLENGKVQPKHTQVVESAVFGTLMFGDFHLPQSKLLVPP